MTTSTVDIDPSLAGDIAAAERRFAETVQALEDEETRPSLMRHGEKLRDLGGRRALAAYELEQVRQRAVTRVAALSPIERAHLDLAAANVDVDAVLAFPVTPESTQHLIEARLRRDRAALVLERHEAREAQVAAAAVTRAALVESHTEEIEAGRLRLTAAHAALASPMRERRLLDVVPAVDSYNGELAAVRAKLVASGLFWVSERDLVGAASAGAVVVNGEVWLHVLPSQAVMWCAEQTLKDHGCGTRFTDGALTSVLGRGSGGFAARNAGLMAAIDGDSSRRRGNRPTGPQAA